MAYVFTDKYSTAGSYVWTWPVGINRAYATTRGGGSGGGTPTSELGGAGGNCGGYTTTVITRGSATSLHVVVGSGGGEETAGGESYVEQDDWSGTPLMWCQANGANAPSGITPGSLAAAGTGISSPAYPQYNTAEFGSLGGSNEPYLPSMFDPLVPSGPTGGGGGGTGGEGGRANANTFENPPGGPGRVFGSPQSGGNGGAPGEPGEDGRTPGAGGGGGGAGSVSGSGADGEVTIGSVPNTAGRCCCGHSFDCVDGVCTRRNDFDGEFVDIPYYWSALAQCIVSGCAPPVESYKCSFGVCSDPNDGSGVYGSLEDCIADGCGAATCTTLAEPECDLMTLLVELAGFNDCDDGTYDWLLSALNGVYFLPFVTTTGYIFHLDLGVDGDYGDPGILYKRKIVVGGVHEETYIRAIEITVLCGDPEDGVAKITQIDFTPNAFAWTEPDAPAPAFASGFGYNPTETLAGTVRECKTDYMLSIFHFTDCLAAPTSFTIEGSILPT